SGQVRGKLPCGGGDTVKVAFAPEGKYLASFGSDPSTVIWDLWRPLQSREFPQRVLSDEELAKNWQILCGTNGVLADSAIWALVACPKNTVPFLRKHLRSLPPASERQLRQWMLDLDSSNFKVRSVASLQLERLGEVAVPTLQETLKGELSPEARRRIEI